MFSYQPPLVTARKGEIGPPRPGTRIGGLEALEPRNWGSGAGLARFGPISRFGRFRGPGNHEIPLTPGVPKNTFLGSSNGKFPEFGRIQQKTAKNSVFPLTPGQFWGVPPPNRAIPGSGRAILGSPAGGGWILGSGTPESGIALDLCFPRNRPISRFSRFWQNSTNSPISCFLAFRRNQGCFVGGCIRLMVVEVPPISEYQHRGF